MIKKFDKNKAKASTKHAIKGKLASSGKGGRTLIKTLENTVRGGKRKLARVEEHGDTILKGESVNPDATMIEITENGGISTRRMTRKEELTDQFKSAARPLSNQAYIRYDKKAIKD